MKTNAGTSRFGFAVVLALLLGAPAMASLFACGGPPAQAKPPAPSLDDSASPSASAASSGPTASPAAADAYAALEAKDFVKARAKGEEALKANPTDAIAHLVLGVCDEADKNVDGAITHYEAALKSDPKNLAACVNFSAILIDRKEWDRAAEVARKGLTNAKASWELYANLGWALRGKGDHDKAAKAFGNAGKLNPKDPDLQLRRGQELLAQKEPDKEGASKAFREAISLATGAADQDGVLAEAGVGLGQAGDPSACATALGKLKDPSPEQLRERAVCKHVAKDLAGSRADLDAAIKKKPTAQMHWSAAAYAMEAGDDKSCKSHLADMAKLATTDEDKAKAAKAPQLCKKK
jgi:tetratricopeptide (TPR) repeat protein